MSKYTPTFIRSREFDGDNISVTFVQLKRKHLLKVAGKITKGEDGTPVLKGEQSEILELMVDILKDCAQSITGLRDASGNVVEIDTVLEEAYFLPLMSWMFSELMLASEINEEEEKNSDAPSGAPSQEEKPALSSQ